jgi:hypothetical protein
VGYEGAVVGKGSGASKDQLKRNNALQDAAIARQNQLQDFIKKNVSQFMSPEGEGYSKEQLALLLSQFMGSNDAAFNDAGEAVRGDLVARVDLAVRIQ